MISVSPSEHRGRGADAPFVSFDVPFELARLQAERAYQLEGHAGRTLTKYPDLRVVLETMKAGSRVPLHETSERITVQVLYGQVRVWMQHGDNRELAEGSFVAIDAGRVHELEALRDCAFLLTLTWPPVVRDERAGAGAGI